MKCVSSCFSCLCGSRNSSRITPSDPIQIVQPNQEKYKPQDASENRGYESTNGGGSINPNFTVGEDDDPDITTNINEETTQPEVSTLKVKALYIEVGKDRLIRVIHIPSLDKSEPSSRKGSLKKENSTSSDKSSEAEELDSSDKVDESKQGEHGEEDEEEYWFTKWARKPRFRSIFAKNPDQRPKLNENNNNSMSPEENNKLSAELEMARAAAAAKRRAWAYNNNGNCEPTITQQPAINPNDEEEEFNSIAIVNSSKQQWTKNGSKEGSASSIQSSTVEVEVSVEKHSDSDISVKEGVSNPAFQDDEDEETDLQVFEDKAEDTSEYKTDDDEQNTSKVSLSSSTGNQSTASVKSSPNAHEEDAIVSEPYEEDKASPGASSAGSLLKGPANNSGPPKKPIIFFIHSISGSSDVWLKQMEFFQQLGYELVAPDLLGHGLSSTPLNPKYYYFESLVQDLILIFDHFTKDDRKVVLIGHGYGACLAAMLTRIRLKNIALLISIAGGGPTPLVRRTCCQDSWFSWKCKLFHSNRIRGRFDNPELKHILPSAIYQNVLSGQVWGDGDSAFYRRVTVPTLLVYGMRDKVVTLVEECEMERTIPKSFLELIDSAGHMVMLDEPEKLNKMLCKFIQSWA